MMTEEVKKEDVKVEEPKPEEKVVDLSPIEERAHLEGWRPKEEWNGDPDEWKDAKTFMRDGELFKKIDEIKRENKTLKKTVTTLKGHYDKVAETEYARAVADLKTQKREALVAGDPDKVIEIDEKLAEARENKSRVVEQEVVAEPTQHPEFVNWVAQNKWYESNSELRAFADTTGFAFTKSHPGVTPGEVFKYVSERVTKAYPELFRNLRKDAPNTVEGGGAPRKTSSKVSNITLTEDEERVMKRLVRSGTLTEDQYKADLVKLESQGKR
jgi:hypothetical protein